MIQIKKCLLHYNQYTHTKSKVVVQSEFLIHSPLRDKQLANATSVEVTQAFNKVANDPLALISLFSGLLY